MRTVIVAGAGTSLAQAISYRPKSQTHHPPLDRDFFQKARRVARTKSGDELNSAIADLLIGITASPEFEDPFEDVSISMEQFFADVFYEVENGDADSEETTFGIYVSLVRVYSQLLSATTNWMATKKGGGPIGQLLASERERATPDTPVTVITFNQDLILENVIQRLNPNPGTWCLQDLYGESAFVEFPSTQDALFPFHSYACSHECRFRLLKLHGSMNWGLASRDRRPTRSELFPSDEPKVLLHDGRKIAGGVAPIGSSLSPRSYFQHLVVPPIYDKHRITRLPLIQRQWGQARAAIESAERILLVGYSMPDADILAQQLMRRSFIANTEVQLIWVINPDATIAEKLNRRLKNKGLHLYEDFDTYLSVVS